MSNRVIGYWLLAIGCWLSSQTVSAGHFLSDVTIDGRVGYSLGATAPLGIPATIRKLNSFTPTANIVLGIDARKPIGDRWGLQVGLLFENKGMDAAVTTKNYHMEMVKGGESLEGVYTGRVEQHVKEWMLTMPITATFDLGQDWRLEAGPYVSFLTSKEFSGNVSNGYLRKDNPTGQKIEMGDAPEERATYDFTDQMRRWQAGVTIGARWLLTERFALRANLAWGVTGVMRSSFKTVEQTLYPIYGTIGVSYVFKN